MKHPSPASNEALRRPPSESLRAFEGRRVPGQKSSSAEMLWHTTLQRTFQSSTDLKQFCRHRQIRWISTQLRVFRPPSTADSPAPASSCIFRSSRPSTSTSSRSKRRAGACRSPCVAACPLTVVGDAAGSGAHADAQRTRTGGARDGNLRPSSAAPCAWVLSRTTDLPASAYPARLYSPASAVSSIAGDYRSLARPDSFPAIWTWRLSRRRPDLRRSRSAARNWYSY